MPGAKDRLRIGIVGAGRIVQAEHIPRFRQIEGVEVVALSNRTAESSRAAAEAAGIARIFGDWRALVTDPDIDAVLVGTWPYLHEPVTVAALAGGKHVLTEARMASDGMAARRMLAASLAHPEAVAMVVPSSFSLWADATITKLLRSEAIGSLRSVRMHFNAVESDPGDFWRWERRFSGNNVMALGIVYEAMVRWLGRALAVQAVVQQFETYRMAPGGAAVRADIPDHILAITEFPGGIQATIEMSAHQRHAPTWQAHFFGTGGTLRADFAARTLELATDEGGYRPVEVRPEDRAGWSAEIDFVAAIRGERPVTLIDFDTGMHYMLFLDAIYDSARRAKRVPVTT